jgi:hypothetical protein
VGAAVRVRHGHAEAGTLATDVAYGSHVDYSLLSISQTRSNFSARAGLDAGRLEYQGSEPRDGHQTGVVGAIVRLGVQR